MCSNSPPARERAADGHCGDQLFLTRYFSWQPPQSFLPMAPNAALKLSRSFTLAMASLASVPNLASRALKSSIFSQIFGSAAVSPPVLELSGNSDGALVAASSKAVKILRAFSISHGASPLAIDAPPLAWTASAFTTPQG